MSTTTIHAAAIGTLVEAELHATYYNNTDFFKIFGKPAPSLGGDSIDWLVPYTGSDVSETYSEGDPAPSPGYVNCARATLAYTRFQTTYRVSGALRDYQKGGYYDAVMLEAQYASQRLSNLVNTTLISGLESAIDSSGSYAGLTRSAVNWASYADDYGNAGELVTTDLDAALQALMTTDRLADYSDLIILSGPAAQFDYAGQALGQSSGSGTGMVVMPSDAKALDGAIYRPQVYYAGIPWYLMQNMTAGTVLILPRSEVIVREARPPTVEQLAKTADEDTWLITTAVQAAVLNPRKCAKLYV